MKTAENYINYTALRIINGIAGIPCEYGDQDESWRVGDRAEAIVRDGKIVEVRFIK